MQAIRAGVAFDGERFLPAGATVLVDGARIVGVEPAACDLPADLPVTTYAGTLLPGLVDAHVHLVADSALGGLERADGYDDARLDLVIRGSLAAQAAHGVTTVRDLGDTGYRTLAHRDAGRPGEPRIVAAGPPLTVAGGHCHYLGGAVEGADAIRAAVTERAARGVDVVKVMASGGMLTPGTDVFGVQFGADDLRVLVDCAHEAGLPVLAHAHSLAGAWHALDAGVDGIEHFSCLTPDGQQASDELLAAVAARGVTVDPTFGNDPAVMQAMGEPPPGIKAMLARLGLTPELMLETRLSLLPRFREHGIRVVSGVDAGVTPPKAHGNLWIAVLDLVRGGYPVDEALATATAVAAEDCGLAGTAGRLGVGYDADLLVVDGDLRTDPSALGRPLAVLARGVSLG